MPCLYQGLPWKIRPHTIRCLCTSFWNAACCFCTSTSTRNCRHCAQHWRSASSQYAYANGLREQHKQERPVQRKRRFCLWMPWMQVLFQLWKFSIRATEGCQLCSEYSELLCSERPVTLYKLTAIVFVIYVHWIHLHFKEAYTPRYERGGGGEWYLDVLATGRSRKRVLLSPDNSNMSRQEGEPKKVGSPELIPKNQERILTFILSCQKPILLCIKA